MQNVIAFPQKAVEPPASRSTKGAKTLFLHIRQTTLIIHLAAQPQIAAATTKVGKGI
jgi:hypothetical protein